MSKIGITRPGELGELASEAILDIVSRSTGGNPVSVYAETDSPIDWSVIEEGGWDLVGIEDDEPVPLRDLAEIAKAWGRACIQLPLLPSILVKRHSEVAQAVEGPVTFSLGGVVAEGSGTVLYGQHPGIQVVRTLGGGDGTPEDAPEGTADAFDLLLRGTEATWTTELSDEVAKEIAIVLAAEATGASVRMLDDAIAYAKEREQFGKPIGSFQAVKHHLANALIKTETADTAFIWGSLRPEEALRGALFSLDNAIDAAELAIQVHGGMGFTWELGLHFYLKRMITSRDFVRELQRNHD